MDGQPFSPAGLSNYMGQLKRAFALRREIVQHSGSTFPEPPGVEKIAQAIPEGSALIEFLRYGREPDDRAPIEPWYGVVVLTAARTPVWLSLAKASEIEELVKDYQEILRNGSDAPDADNQLRMVLQSLHETVWQPLQGALDRATNVFVSPDGALHRLSFATLLDEDRFVAEDYEIRYVSAGRDLLKTGRQNSSRVMEIWANPDFGNAATGAATANKAAASSRGFFVAAFQALPGTAREAVALAKVAPAHGVTVKIHEGMDASKAELMKVQQPYILHLATHGFFDPSKSSRRNKRSGSSRRARNSQPNGITSLMVGGMAPQWTEMNDLLDSMHSSGLALSRANETVAALQRGDRPAQALDGLVFASELAALDLSETWLVALSACDTAIGGIADGEDVLALRRAFQQAGARNVLCSLWRVNDTYAAPFMKDFYTAALTSGDAGGALAAVQRAELRKAANGSLAQRVKLVGPFVLTGAGLPGAARQRQP